MHSFNPLPLPPRGRIFVAPPGVGGGVSNLAHHMLWRVDDLHVAYAPLVPRATSSMPSAGQLREGGEAVDKVSSRELLQQQHAGKLI